MVGLRHIWKRLAMRHRNCGSQQDRRRHGNRDVTEYRHQLTAQGTSGENGDLLQITLTSATLLDTCGDSRSGHRRLFGGNGTMQDVNEHKTEPVVEADSECLCQRWQMGPRDERLDERHYG